MNSQVYCNSNAYLEIILSQCEIFGKALSFKFEKFRSTRALFFYEIEKCRSFHMTAMFNANLKFDHGYHTQKFAPPLILHFILGTVTENWHRSIYFFYLNFKFGQIQLNARKIDNFSNFWLLKPQILLHKVICTGQSFFWCIASHIWILSNESQWKVPPKNFKLNFLRSCRS